MSHTKGPWKWEDGYIVDSQQVPYPVASVNAMGSVAESEANARLIAQAPCMLETLRNLTEWLETFATEDSVASLHEDIQKARDLINKATGAQEDGQ